jgi:tRNA threonylcarbamoyladenosine biosynthesis protein TsaB
VQNIVICLAVNTANTLLSVALVRDGAALWHFESTETRDQGNLILQQAKQGLAGAKLGFSDLGLLAVATGPGSFTGIRIGLAAMRGLALAAKLPVLGISSFALRAAPRPGHANIVALESWREELYFEAAGADGKTLVPPVNVTPADFVKLLPQGGGPYVISGDAAEKLHKVLPEAVLDAAPRTAAHLAALAVAAFDAKRPPARPVPFYLREPDVTFSGRAGNA